MNNIPVVEMIYGEKKVTVVMLIVIVNGEKEGDKESLSKLVILLNDDDEGGGLLPADLADPGRHAEDSPQDQVHHRHLLFHLQKHFSLSTYKCHAL